MRVSCSIAAPAMCAVLATEMDDDGQPIREFDDTPGDFNRVAATTAKQIILQRLRDAEHELTFGEYAGREGDVVGGVIQQQHDSRNVFVDLGKVEAVLPAGEQVPGERYEHGARIRCYVVQVHKGRARPADHVVPHASRPGAQAVRARSARDRRRFGRDRGARPRGRSPHRRSPCGRRCPA